MTNSQKYPPKEAETFANLATLFKFYCKLNQQKLKHKSFDDVANKTETMDLH